MTDLQALFREIEQLSPEEFEQLDRFIVAYRADISSARPGPEEQDIEARVAALHEALAEFRAGLSEQELNELVAAMNVDYSYPMKDLAMFDWLDDIPEDER